MSVLQVFEEELALLRASHSHRSLRFLSDPKGKYAFLDGREILLFCGNDYLGLAHHPRLIRAFKQAAELYGVGAGAARLISGTTDLHTRLEKEIADFKKKEKALLFTAGYLANIGVVSALANEKDVIVMDKLCHASLIDGARLSGAAIRVFPHKNYRRCFEILEKSKNYRRRVLVSDTVFSMDGDCADLNELARLKKKYECLLILDDAHGTGVLGAGGRGAVEEAGLENEVDVIVGTLSKSLGCLGGFAATSKTIWEYLINHARPFIFATALPPAVCAAASQALRLIREEPGLRADLARNVQKMTRGLFEAGLLQEKISSPIFPILIGSEEDALAVSDRLRDQGFLAPAIRPPSVPKGKARLRVTLRADHTEEDIERFLGALVSCLGKSKQSPIA